MIEVWSKLNETCLVSFIIMPWFSLFACLFLAVTKGHSIQDLYKSGYLLCPILNLIVLLVSLTALNAIFPSPCPNSLVVCTRGGGGSTSI